MRSRILIRNCRLPGSTGSGTLDIFVENRSISRIAGNLKPPEDAHIIDARGNVVIPGCIDVHIQGAGGADVLDGTRESIGTISKTLARQGTTGFLATTIMKPRQHNHHLDIIADSVRTETDGAALLGIHLEGPFINPEKRGGIAPDSIYSPSGDRLNSILSLTRGALSVMTIAPEIKGTRSIIRELIRNNIVVSFGHSNATYNQTLDAIRSGINHVTHIFNAMPSLHHRNPGPLPAIMESSGVYVQIISDGVHVHPTVIALLEKTIGTGRCICITDGVAGLGLPDGSYLYNEREYISRNGTARYTDGTLIGTTMSLLKMSLRFKEYTGCSFKNAIATVSINPARALNIDTKKGSIEAGKDADLVILSPKYEPVCTIVEGQIAYLNSSGIITHHR